MQANNNPYSPQGFNKKLEDYKKQQTEDINQQNKELVDNLNKSNQYNTKQLGDQIGNVNGYVGKTYDTLNNQMNNLTDNMGLALNQQKDDYTKQITDAGNSFNTQLKTAQDAQTKALNDQNTNLTNMINTNNTNLTNQIGDVRKSEQDLGKQFTGLSDKFNTIAYTDYINKQKANVQSQGNVFKSSDNDYYTQQFKDMYNLPNLNTVDLVSGQQNAPDYMINYANGGRVGKAVGGGFIHREPMERGLGEYTIKRQEERH
jgi:hypothetical protein